MIISMIDHPKEPFILPNLSFQLPQFLLKDLRSFVVGHSFDDAHNRKAQLYNILDLLVSQGKFDDFLGNDCFIKDKYLYTLNMSIVDCIEESSVS